MIINDNEVIVDDALYNLKDFSKVHPGGAYILNIFGGKDATIHYYMIHHNHIKSKKNILEQYKIKDIDDSSEDFYLVNKLQNRM